MSTDVDEALERLGEGVREERAGDVEAAAGALRRHVAARLSEVRLEPEDRLLAQRRRLHHRLEVLEAKAQAGRFEDAEEDRQEVAPLARELAEAIGSRDPAEEAEPGRPLLRRAAILAEREVRARWRPAAVVAVLALLVLGLGLHAGSGAAGPLVALAALGGVVVATGVLAEDAQAGRLHLVVGHGISRAGLTAVKLAATVGLLTGVFLAAALVGGLVGRLLGALGLLTTTGRGLALALVAGAFAGLLASLEATGRSSRASLVAGVLAYLVLGPIWRSAFLAGAQTGGPATSLGAEILYLASPVAAGHSVLEAGGTFDAVVGILVLLAWILVTASAASIVVQRHGFEASTDQSS